MAEISYAYIQVDGDGAVQNIAMFENYEDANQMCIRDRISSISKINSMSSSLPLERNVL